MGRLKKIQELNITTTNGPVIVKEAISLLSVDYPSEGLNDMARKINEIIIFITK